jgi:TonB family protein
MRLQMALAATALAAASHVGGAAAREAADAESSTTLDPIVVTAPPQPRVRLNPPYPMEARRRWEEGCVLLRWTIRPDGQTDDFAVLESHPLGVFEKTVIGAVYKWKYDPSPRARTVVEKFDFHNQSFSTQPRYSVARAVKVPVGVDSSGALKYHLDMMLTGYTPPKCGKKT